MKRYILVTMILLVLAILPVNANAPVTNTVHTTLPITLPKTITPILNMTLLSATVNGCSQVANVNATWTGQGYYTVGPSSFSLIIKTKNAVYANQTDLVSGNNTVSLWYLFKNIPITLQVSFQSCTNINAETLVYSDGTFFFILH